MCYFFFLLFFINTVITKLDKVIILQHILHGVIHVQQAQTLTPAHDKTCLFHSGNTTVVWFVLHVTFKRFLSEPLDRVGGVPAGHCQPLISDVDSKTRHRASAGRGCSETCAPLSQVPLSAAYSSATNQTRLGSHSSPASHLWGSLTHEVGLTDVWTPI